MVLPKGLFGAACVISKSKKNDYKLTI